MSSSYETIASVSGGEIYRTDNDGIEDLSRIVEGDIRASKVDHSATYFTILFPNPHYIKTSLWL